MHTRSYCLKGPRVCTEEDIILIHQNLSASKNDFNDDDGFTAVQKKKKNDKQIEGSPRVTRGQVKK